MAIGEHRARKRKEAFRKEAHHPITKSYFIAAAQISRNAWPAGGKEDTRLRAAKFLGP